MPYNKKKLKPFKTDSEAQEWMEENCNKCKLYDCRIKRTYREGQIINPTVKQAEWMGVSGDELTDKCTKFKEVAPIHKQKDRVDNFINNCY